MKFSWNQGIYRQILSVALIPAALVGLSLIIYLVSARLGDLEDSFSQRGNAISQQIASISQYGIFSGNREPVEVAIHAIQSLNPDVDQIQVFDETGALFVDNRRRVTTKDSLRLFLSPIRPIQPKEDPNELFFEEADNVSLQEKVNAGTVIVLINTTVLQQTKNELLLRAMIILLIGVFGTLFLARVFASRIARPIETLTEAVSKVRSGELETKINTNTRGEIGKLEKGFNAMTIELASANEEMTRQVDQATGDLQQTMEIMEIQNVELDLARKRAIEANRVKSQFLASMSHEIRTPMNGIAGFVELLTQTDLTQQQSEYLDTIHISTNNLLGIINDILDFSKLESGKFSLNSEDFGLRELVENVIDLLSNQARYKGLDLVFLVAEDVPDQLIGDPIRIRQILFNLIGNAIKFTDQGDVSMRITSEYLGDGNIRLFISVADTGTGIPQKDLEILFNPFAQGSLTIRQAHQGTGLGLSICQQLAEAMSGKISVRSMEGQGSTFQVDIKLGISQEPPPVKDYGFHNEQVILIDSHLLSQRSLEQQIRGLGLRPISLTQWPASDFDEPDTKPRIVLLSINQGDNNQSQNIKRIKEESQLPLICLLSSLDTSQHRVLMECGADLILGKPIKSATLERALHGILDPEAQRSMALAQPDKIPEQPPSVMDYQVLVVDDNEINSKLMKALLSSRGIDATIAHNGHAAIQEVKNHRFDLIFMDIHMPDMDGETAANKIRKQAGYTETPIIALTADITQQDKFNTSGAPFNGGLIKPVEQNQLDNLLAKCLFDQRIVDITDGECSCAVKPDRIRDLEKAIQVTGGSKEIADNLYVQFVDELPEAIRGLEEDLRRQDLGSMWDNAHRLHGAAAATATLAIHAALGVLQTSIKQSDMDAVQRHLVVVKKEAKRILEQ